MNECLQSLSAGHGALDPGGWMTEENLPWTPLVQWAVLSPAAQGDDLKNCCV